MSFIVSAIGRRFESRRASAIAKANCPVIEALEGRCLLSANYLLTTLAFFNGANGSIPTAGLTMDSAGNMYGTTQFGGEFGDGTVFEIPATNGELTTLASFGGTNGAHPVGGLTLDAAGNLYGTTKDGGVSNKGTVFEIPAGTDTLTTVVSFNVANGDNPIGGLTRDSAGNLYGTTYSGGSSNKGTVFEIPAGGGTLTAVTSFTGANGANPSAALTSDPAGNLFGTTEFGGASGAGTVFEILAGSNAVTTLASFNVINGSGPDTDVTLDTAGNLYGTTESGGRAGGGNGTVFEIAAGSGVITTLARFDGTSNGGDQPQSGITLDSAGNLYGTTEESFSFTHPAGTVFEIDKASGTVNTLLSFDGANGGFPIGDLTIDSAGDLLGTTSVGGIPVPGTSGDGTVFELSPTTMPIAAPISGSNAAVPFQTVSLNFSAITHGPGYQYQIDWGDGSGVQTVPAPLVDATGIQTGHVFTSPGSYNVSLAVLDGDGVTSQRVSYPITVTQALSVNGETSASIQTTLQDVANNIQQSTDGPTPPILLQISDQATLDNTLSAIAGLRVSTNAPTVDITVDASDATYQAAQVSVPPNVTLTLNGTSFVGAYQITSAPGYLLTTLVSFTHFENPSAGLILDSEGNLYGTTAGGGTDDNGTIFKVDPANGTLTILASITEPATSGGGLTLDSAGNIYGTLESGGINGQGSVFEVAANSGVLSTLASFDGTNGAYPWAGVTLDSGGNLYGTTSGGGAYGDGTVFEIAAGSDAITTLASFNGANGANPVAGLTFDSAGNLYGTTQNGGGPTIPGGIPSGTVFEIQAGSNSITTLATFDGYDGARPLGGVTLDSAGNLYGTTQGGIDTGSGAGDGEDPPPPTGNTAAGTVFEIAAGSGVITTLASFDGTGASNPSAGLIRDSAGNLYGTTQGGGDLGGGTVFEVAAGSGAITILASFSDPGGAPGLVADAAGDLFGTRPLGGSGSGIVFELRSTKPVATISGTDTVALSQTLPLTFSATDVLPATDAGGYQYQINWGDGSELQTIAAEPGNGAGINLNHVFTATGSYDVSLTVLDSDGLLSQPVTYPITVTQALTITGGTSGSIQSTLQDIADNVQQSSTGGSTPPIQVQISDQTSLDNTLSAISGLQVSASAPTVEITVDASNATYQDTQVSVPPNVTLTLNGATFVGGSPALIVNSGTLVITNSTLTNSTNAPTILVKGGNLILRGDTIEQSSTVFAQPAIEVDGGTVDLGSAATPGGNTLDTRGGGMLVNNTSANPNAVPIDPAAANVFEMDGTPIASNSGLEGEVWVDFNNDGNVDFGEQGINGVTITLSGRDTLGRAVTVTSVTGTDGIYTFENLSPGVYTITETGGAALSGFTAGIDSAGTLSAASTLPGVFSEVPVGPEKTGFYYNFGHLPAPGSTVSKGQAAGIGFWANKNGQSLIKQMAASKPLGAWLAATLPSVFGTLTQANATQIASLYQNDFLLKDKLAAQYMATALNVFATDASLGGAYAKSYGFSVGTYGLADSTWNVGGDGAAFGVANNTTLTVLQLLQDGQSAIDSADSTLRKMALDVFGGINSKGGL